MICAFVRTPEQTSTRDRVDYVTADALRALGALTTEANFATSVGDALLIHARASELREAILALEDIAIRQADRLCGSHQ